MDLPIDAQPVGLLHDRWHAFGSGCGGLVKSSQIIGLGVHLGGLHILIRRVPSITMHESLAKARLRASLLVTILSTNVRRNFVLADLVVLGDLVI